MLPFNTIRPADPKIRDCIAYYYFMKNGGPTLPIKFIHFPHYRNTLNFYSNSEIHLDRKCRIVIPKADAGIKSVITLNTIRAKWAEVSGPYDIIGVGFNPLGFNRFISHAIKDIVLEPIQFFDNYWEDLAPVIEEVFQVQKLETKVSLLDSFFSSHFHDFIDKRIQIMEKDVFETSGLISIAELSQKNDINRRTVLRLFRAHLGYSVEEYKGIIKFRKAFNAYQEDPDKPSLTALAYDTKYYDQSDFIRHFKAYTNHLPSEVLDSLKTVSGEGIHWMFV